MTKAKTTKKVTKKVKVMKKSIENTEKKIERNPTFQAITDLSSLVIFSLAFAIIFLLLAFINYPKFLHYDIRYNWISDLGNQLLNPLGWYWFTLGCIICGILLFVIFLKNSRLDLRFFGSIMSLGLIMVGIFSSLFVIQHSLFASWYFIGSLGCILIMSLSLIPKKICIFGFIAAIINVIFLIFFTQLLEWATFLTNFTFINFASTIRE